MTITEDESTSDVESPSQACRFPEHRADELIDFAKSAVCHYAGFYDEDLIQVVAMEAVRSFDQSKGNLKGLVWKIAELRHLDEQKKAGRRAKHIAAFSERISEQVEQSRVSRGRPGCTDQQKLMLYRLKVQHGLTMRGVRRFLLSCPDARKAMGFRKVPGVTVIHRAVRWAMRQ